MRIFVFLALFSTSIAAQGQEIASCANPKGQAYYAESGKVSKDSSGWTKTSVPKGTVRLVRINRNHYDIIYASEYLGRTSSRDEGAQISLLGAGNNVFSILVVYPGTLAEVYTFLRSTSGKLEYIHTMSRSGNGVSTTTQSTVMRGDCTYINFKAIARQSAGKTNSSG